VPRLVRRAFPFLMGLKRIGRVLLRDEGPGLGGWLRLLAGIRSGEWHQMDLVMVFLALCLLAWMRGKLTAPGNGNAGRAAARIRCQSCRRSLCWSSVPTLAWDAAR